ncbi:MAG: ferrous iron transport protein B [Betaproteobacteria bacterium]|nr:ferrous iron transport protein B [Betaproteobacteria bacterium]
MHGHILTGAAERPEREARTYALVGAPNVGKSVVFHRLTGTYVDVSNYPGTTVEVARAAARFEAGATILDTPGALAFPSRSDDERAALRALLHENPAALGQVADAKHLRRSLAITLALAETGRPMVLALNMSDEADARGVAIDVARLSKALGIDVVRTVATTGEGVRQLAHGLARARVCVAQAAYPQPLARLIDAVTLRLADRLARAPIAHRGMAILFLGRDPEVEAWLAVHVPDAMRDLVLLREAAERDGGRLAPVIAHARAEAAARIAASALSATKAAPTRSTLAGRLVLHPVWSLPILLGVLSLTYLFVGVLGAGTLVGWLEEGLFGGTINPAVTRFVEARAPWPWLASLLVGRYGLWTMGMTYAVALVLPIVTTFFLAFGFLEDSGYFARLAVLANRSFARIGLNGRAVLPMVLGLGCVTMATLTTRILATPRERLIATFLMALAIPCSAQLGVVMGMLGALGLAWLLAWVGVLVAVIGLAGFLAARLIPGKRIPLVAELPPLRWPVAGNVLKKTSARLYWYLREVIPLFLAGTFAMWSLDASGALPWIVARAEPLVTGWLGLPREAAAAFVMGFLRRDFGATGLFAMGAALSPAQALVGMVTITLFVPCIASVLMIGKEQGAARAALMVAMIVPVAVLVGGLVRLALVAAGLA